MEHIIAILDFTRGVVHIYKTFIPKDMDSDNFVVEEYGNNALYMLDPVQINIEL